MFAAGWSVVLLLRVGVVVALAGPSVVVSVFVFVFVLLTAAAASGLTAAGLGLIWLLTSRCRCFGLASGRVKINQINIMGIKYNKNNNPVQVT